MNTNAGVSSSNVLPLIQRLRAALTKADPELRAPALLGNLVQSRLDRVPLPGSGATLQRWQALAEVAAHDLSLAKLYEGHTDAIAILAELGDDTAAEGVWGVWAAEMPGNRVLIESAADGRVSLLGRKAWCSGAADLSHGLLTAWHRDGRGPQLVRVALKQPSIEMDGSAWRAVGMAGSASVDVSFSGALADPVGDMGDYLSRPGFWQGGAGVAACWYGGALTLGAALREALVRQPQIQRTTLRMSALGKIDLSLQGTAALLRAAAQWIDQHPKADASGFALRVRLAAEDSARRVLDEAGRALGAAAFCRDAHFARAAADLPVFIRQSHAERDFAALGERLLSGDQSSWAL